MHRPRRFALALAFVAMSMEARAQVGGGSDGPPRSLTLEQALQLAVDHYPTVRAALEQVSASTAPSTSMPRD